MEIGVGVQLGKYSWEKGWDEGFTLEDPVSSLYPHPPISSP